MGRRACAWSWDTWGFCRCGARTIATSWLAGAPRSTIIRPILIDREIPKLQARLDELNQLSAGGTALTAEQKQEFIEVTSRLKLLSDRRKILLDRTGDEYVTDPPKLAAKP